MSVTIRLTLTGRKNLPSYRMVVANTRSKRNGRALDVVGYYNPSMSPVQFGYDKDKFKEWVNKGALVSDSVKTLIEGKYNYKKYDPKGEKAAAEAQAAAAKAAKETPVQEVQEEQQETPAAETAAPTETEATEQTEQPQE